MFAEGQRERRLADYAELLATARRFYREAAERARRADIVESGAEPGGEPGAAPSGEPGGERGGEPALSRRERGGDPRPTGAGR